MLSPNADDTIDLDVPSPSAALAEQLKEEEAEELSSSSSSDEDDDHDDEFGSSDQSSSSSSSSRSEQNIDPVAIDFSAATTTTTTSSSSLSQERPCIMKGGHGPASSSDGFSIFVTARSLLLSDVSLSRDTTLSPGFRSAAAMAGWDDESLLMAALQEEDNCLPVGLVVEEDEEKGKERKKENTDMQEMSPIFVKKISHIDSIRNVRDRKRDQRTPQQAATPLSAGRRSRKPRRQGIHGCSPEALPIGDLSLKEEFRTGISSELPSGDGGKNLEEEMKREAKKAPLVAASSSLSSSSSSSSSSPSSSSSDAAVAGDVPFSSSLSSSSSSYDAAVSGNGVSASFVSLKEAFRTEMSSEAVRCRDGSKNMQEDLKGEQKQRTVAIMPSSSSSSNASDHGVAISVLPKLQDTKPACLDQLKDELSCAVCLDICYEPSSTSCGHSFCRACLQSVLQRCGLRCPKCRQQLKGETWRNCPVNVVLWNTVQLLFPAEIEARKEALRAGNKKDDEEPRRATGSTAAVITSGQQHGGTSSDAGTATANWRSARPPAAGLLRRRGGSSGASGGGHSRRLSSVTTGVSPANLSIVGDEAGSSLSSAELRRQRQVRADAVFARQLQMQLVMRSRQEAEDIATGPGGSGRRASSSSSSNLASAAANLRAVAQRVARYQTRH